VSDHVSSRRTVGRHVVAGRRLRVERLTWDNHPGLSFELYDDVTGECLTMDGAFDDYPAMAQMRDAARSHS
jgi:hypothetical protein